MADNRTKAQRSYNMACIRSKNTKPEILIRKFLFSKGYRYRINYKKLPGSPDIVLRGYKCIVFVHGCFWHGHLGCKYAKRPVTNSVFWSEKINSNYYRDIKNTEQLEDLGWKVITVWECQLTKGTIDLTYNELLKEINSNRK